MFRQALAKFGTNQGIVVASAILFALSGLDAAFTLLGLTLEVVKEANPLMDLLIARSPLAFIGLKLVLPVAIGFYLWRNHRKDPLLITLALTISIAIYVIITGFHLYWVFELRTT